MWVVIISEENDVSTTLECTWLGELLEEPTSTHSLQQRYVA